MTVQEALKQIGASWNPQGWCLGRSMPPELRRALMDLGDFIQNALPNAIQLAISSQIPPPQREDIVGDGAFVKILDNLHDDQNVPGKALPQFPPPRDGRRVIAHANPAPSWTGGSTKTHELGNYWRQYVTGIKVDDADHVKGVILREVEVIPAVATSDQNNATDPPTVSIRFCVDWTGLNPGDESFQCVLPYTGDIYPDVREGDIIGVLADGSTDSNVDYVAVTDYAAFKRRVVPAIACADYNRSATPFPTVQIRLCEDWAGNNPGDDAHTCCLPYTRGNFPNVREGDVIGVIPNGSTDSGIDYVAVTGYLDDPIGTVKAWVGDEADIPAGWEIFAAGRYLKGWESGGPDPGEEGGSATHIHDPHDISHSHPHKHGWPDDVDVAEQWLRHEHPFADHSHGFHLPSHSVIDVIWGTGEEDEHYRVPRTRIWPDDPDYPLGDGGIGGETDAVNGRTDRPDLWIHGDGEYDVYTKEEACEFSGQVDHEPAPNDPLHVVVYWIKRVS